MGWIIFAAVVAALFALLCCSVKLVFRYDSEICLKISFLMFTIYKIPAEKRKAKRRDKRKKTTAEKDIAEPKKPSAEMQAVGEDNPAEKKAEEQRVLTEKTGGEDNPAEKKAEEQRVLTEKAGGEGKSSEKKSEEPPASEESPEKKKASLSDILEVVKLLYEGLGRPLKKLLKRARIYHFYIHIICGGEDAAKAAINFGKTNILVGNALGWLATVFTLKAPDDIHIDVNFYRENTTAECSLTMKLSLLAALAFLFTGAGRSVRYLLKNPNASAALKSLKK